MPLVCPVVARGAFFVCVCVVYFFVGVVFWCFGVLAPVADRRARARDAIATPRGASARRVIRLVRCRASDGWQAMD